jgi:hypothetical protein
LLQAALREQLRQAITAGVDVAEGVAGAFKFESGVVTASDEGEIEEVKEIQKLKVARFPADDFRMDERKYDAKPIVILALLGFCAALFSYALEIVAGGLNSMILLVVPPVVFGGSVGGYFRLRQRSLSVLRIAAFIAACIAAYALSFRSAFLLIALLRTRFPMDNDGLPLSISFGGSWVGACLVLAAGLFLFGPGNVEWRSLGRLFVSSVIGGLLGMTGWERQPLLFLVWQTGVALCLGWMISREEPDVT